MLARIAPCIVALLAACSGDPPSNGQMRQPEAPPMAQAGSGAIAIPTVDCPPSNPFCNGSGSTGSAPLQPPSDGTTSCGQVPIDLKPAGVNIMIAVDGSPSMVTHWPMIETAVRSLALANPSAQLGVHVFWGEPADVFSGTTTNTSNNICGAVHNDVLDLGSHAEQELVSFLGDAPRGQWFIDGQIEVSPVIEPLNYYLTNATKLADPARTNYLVLLSDGNDNCFGSFFASNGDKLAAFQKVAVELYKQGIRVIPIGFDAPTVAQTDPFAPPGAVMPNTDMDALQTLLDHGGAALVEVPKADDAAKLERAVQQVGQRISNCRFELPAELDPNASLSPFELGFSINGQVIPRDRLEQSGWNFVSGGTSQVELFGDGCVAIQSGQPIQVGKACGSNVCGTASIKVETRPRSVLLALDSSASRIECVDGSFDCLSLPGSSPTRPLTFWETVQHAIGTTLTAPINDDVAFGMQFFPSKTAEAWSCTVEPQAEIAPGQGTEVGIMKAMLEKLPFGFSPVVQVIENIAANPGGLADPSVLGAVVVLSDGGDNCAEQADGVVTRLGAAAKTLLEKGVKTYVVRYGSEAGRTPEGEDQLRALVTEGGTAMVDPMNPSAKPYVDATTAEQLASALADISDRLATCSFALEGLPTNEAEKDEANLYLNGEVIPFDSMNAKQDGWAWVDAARTMVELYGPSCTAFKTNRRTSIVVEFGCPAVTVDVL